jgi:hypothetical protein
MRLIDEAISNLKYVGEVLSYKTRRLDSITREKIVNSLKHLEQAVEELKAIDTKREGD